MAHGQRAAYKENKRIDYWKKRPGNMGGSTRGKYTKQCTHRAERRMAKTMIDEQMDKD